jgi:hypothetical protein
LEGMDYNFRASVIDVRVKWKQMELGSTSEQWRSLFAGCVYSPFSLSPEGTPSSPFPKTQNFVPHLIEKRYSKLKLRLAIIYVKTKNDWFSTSWSSQLWLLWNFDW